MKQLLATFTLMGLLILGSCGSAESKIEMTYAETQCADPWRPGNGFGDPTTVQEGLINYFDDLGVAVSEIKIIDNGDIITCLACDCPSNRVISLKVDESDQSLMEGEGFVKS